MFIAQKRGYYAEEGLAVDIILMAGLTGTRALIGNSVEFGSASNPTAAVQGAKLKILMVFNDKPPGIFAARPGLKSVSVRPDGLTIGAMLTGMVQGAVLGESGVLYDLDKMIYLGSHARYAPYAFLSRKGAGLSSKDKLKTASGVRIGAPSVGHTLYATARLFAYILDMKEPRFVTGYTPRELDLVIDRGEIDARVNIVDSTIQRNPHWFEKDLIDLHATLDIPKGVTHAHPRFAKLPDLDTFAKSKREERLIELLRALRGTGQPFVVPPGTPTDRVDILKEAMRKALRDPEYVAAYEKLTTEPAMPLMPEEYDKALREIPREPELIDLVKKLSGAGPLPPR